MITTPYKNKKELKANIGKHLEYQETSFFGPEYKSTGWFCVTNHPKRSWFAKVTMTNDIITKVE
jgi:hypothetical protein